MPPNQSEHILALAQRLRLLRAEDVRAQGWSPQLLIKLHQAGSLADVVVLMHTLLWPATQVAQAHSVATATWRPANLAWA